MIFYVFCYILFSLLLDTIIGLKHIKTNSLHSFNNNLLRSMDSGNHETETILVTSVNTDYMNLKEIILASLKRNKFYSIPFITPINGQLSVSNITDPSYDTLTMSLDISDKIYYCNDISESKGKDEYLNMVKQWTDTLMDELCEVKTSIDKVTVTTIPFIQKSKFAFLSVLLIFVFILLILFLSL